MNERFQELHNQARDFYLQDEYLDVSTKELHRLVEQKFAELIVEECVKVAHPKLTDVGEWAAGMRLVQQRLKQHFGVEE